MAQMTIVGLGAGHIEQLPLGVYRLLTTEQAPLYARTAQHPVVSELEEEGVSFTCFDDVYTEHDSFAAVYTEIVGHLFQAVKEHDAIIYAVPGHPLVAEQTVQLLLEQAESNGIELEIYGGQSFIDPMFQALRLDPIDGFVLKDASQLQAADIQPQLPLLIPQVYDAFVASELKLTLMDVYPDDYPVTMVTAAGSKTLERIMRIPLYELDRSFDPTNATSVYVPPTDEPAITHRTYEAARDIVRTLRGPNGCPWDRKQTHESLKKYAREEVEELCEAIDEGDIDPLADELGDVLLQVFLHAQIAEDNGYFTMEDVLQRLSDKMVRRHPHVFGDAKAVSEEDVNRIWQAVKAEEQADDNEHH